MNTRTVFSTVFWAVQFTVVYCSVATASDTNEQWQQQMLFSPTRQQVQLEQNGRVMIYSGIKSADITLAMDRYFGRIENMMFVNTVQTNAEGEPIIDSSSGEPVIDDDC
jgi:hypothetical protein